MGDTQFDALFDVVKRRRSVRKFETGRTIDRQTLTNIANSGRWAPSGANVQPWDFIVIDDVETRDRVIEVFMSQANRLKQFARGFPAVYKTYLTNTVAIIIVLGDPRWKINFPHGINDETELEYAENNENIFFSSLGAAIQNIQLGVTASGLTSAWLSGGGEKTTNEDLATLLGYPNFLRAYGTIPIGYPAKDIAYRYRRPLEQVIHWNGYDPKKFRTDEQLAFHHEKLRPFTMYRTTESIEDWDDVDEKLGQWKAAYSSGVTNPSGKL